MQQEGLNTVLSKTESSVISLARQGNFIKDFQVNDIRWEDIALAIDAASTQVGAKDIIDEQEFDLLIKPFLREHYSDLSAKEIVNAFSMYNAEKICEDLEYKGFNQRFIGKVLTGYRVYKNKIVDRHIEEVKRREIQLEDHRMTPEECYNMILNWIEQHNQLLFFAPYREAFKYLEEKGIISDSVQDKEKFAEQLRQKLKLDLFYAKKNNNARLATDISNTLNNPAFFRMECQYQRAEEYFKTLLK